MSSGSLVGYEHLGSLCNTGADMLLIDEIATELKSSAVAGGRAH